MSSKQLHMEHPIIFLLEFNFQMKNVISINLDLLILKVILILIYLDIQFYYVLLLGDFLFQK